LAPTQRTAAEAEPPATAESATHSAPKRIGGQAWRCVIPSPFRLRYEGQQYPAEKQRSWMLD